MAKITRAIQKIFGGSLTASGNIAKFGSLAAGSPAYSLDPAVIQALTEYLQGWDAATIGNSSPALQDRNAIDFLVTRQLAYIFQSGIPEWQIDTTYFIGGWVTVDSVIYVSITDDNLANDVSDTNNWATLASTLTGVIVNPSQLTRAWVRFAGSSGTITDSLGVTSVTRSGTGNYLIDFDSAFANANYAYSLSCSQENAIAAMIAATRFPGDVLSTTQFRLRTASTFDSSAFDAPEVCAQFWSTG